MSWTEAKQSTGGGEIFRGYGSRKLTRSESSPLQSMTKSRKPCKQEEEQGDDDQDPTADLRRRRHLQKPLVPALQQENGGVILLPLR